MILDDGGDLTNMVLDNYPNLVKNENFRKTTLVFIDFMKDSIVKLFHYQQLMLMILLQNQNLIINTV